MMILTLTSEQKAPLLRMGLELWGAALGNSTPVGRRLWRRMSEPRRGDYVIEVSTAATLLHREDFSDTRWDGQLVRYERTEDRPWEVVEDGEMIQRGTEVVEVCLNPDETTFDWVNARLVAVMGEDGGELLTFEERYPSIVREPLTGGFFR
jgi:hypothetical protein